jgi:hypothetical protein
MIKDPIIKLAAFAEDLQRLAKKHKIELLENNGRILQPAETATGENSDTYSIDLRVKQ